MAVGTAYTMHAEGQAAKYNAAVDTQNAKVATTQAQNANAMGTYQQNEAAIRGKLAEGHQMAVMSANNVDVTTGSAADILGDTAMFTGMNENQARINAQQRAYGFQVQSLSDQGAAAYAKYSGRTQQIGSFLQGASSVANMAAKSPSLGGGSGTLLTGGNYSGGNGFSSYGMMNNFGGGGLG
jgi:hypothetical protein